MSLRLLRQLTTIIALFAVGSSGGLAQSLGGAKHRVGGEGLTFLLSDEFLQCELPGEEGRLLQWSNGKLQVTYTRDWLQDWEATEQGGKNFCGRKFVRTDVKVSFRSKPLGITLKLRSPESSGGVDYISISGDSSNHVCAIATNILEGFEYSNLASRIKVDYISPGAEYFVMLNEVGQVRAAKLGDIVTRNQGRVVEISRDFVRVVEIAPDGSGGYAEVPIVLNWHKPERP
jgi:hypothetical protein